MAENTTSSSYEVPARTIKTPAHLSPAAQAHLIPTPDMPHPPIEDKAAWKAFVQQVDSSTVVPLQRMAGQFRGEIVTREVDAARFYDIVPAGLPANDRSVILDFHGGGLVYCGKQRVEGTERVSNS